MTRTRRSAKDAGTAFERAIANYLATALNDDRIDRRARNGIKDRGDITGLRAHGQRIVAECKNTSRIDLGGWVAEAHLEAGNDDALTGVVIHKRKGITHPGRQYVTCTVDDLLALLTGVRHGHRAEEAIA